MKQGSLVTKIVTFVLVAAVAVYMFLQITQALYNPVRTQEAALFSTEESFNVGGYFIRDETVLPREQGIPVMMVGEGERTSKGQAVAKIYEDADSLEKNAALISLDERISLFEHIKARVGDTMPNAELESSIVKSLSGLTELRDRGSFSRLSEFASEFKNLILKRGYAYAEEQEINAVLSSLTRERSALAGQVSRETRVVTAQIPGTFTSMVDGFENTLSPDIIKTLTPQSIAGLGALRDESLRNTGMGKIVSGHTWYYSVTMDKETLSLIKDRPSVTVRFPSAGVDAPMKIYHISDPVDGRCAVTFYSMDMLKETILLRDQQAEIIYRSYTGVKIPREALRLGEGGVRGVYCVQGRNAVFKPVEIIYETESYYIAYYDKEAPRALRPGDEIITAAKDLYDGKVIG